MRGRERRIFVLESKAAQSFAAVGVGRSSLGVVPRRVVAVADFLRRLVPGPAFHKRVHPQIQVERRHIRPNVADLLLARSPDFLHVVKVLLDGGTIRKRLDDLAGRGAGVGAVEAVSVVRKRFFVERNLFRSSGLKSALRRNGRVVPGQVLT